VVDSDVGKTNQHTKLKRLKVLDQMLSTNNLVFFLVHAPPPPWRLAAALHFLSVLFPQLMPLMVVASPEA
jgi:hypothetical protein